MRALAFDGVLLAKSLHAAPHAAAHRGKNRQGDGGGGGGEHRGFEPPGLPKVGLENNLDEAPRRFQTPSLFAATTSKRYSPGGRFR